MKYGSIEKALIVKEIRGMQIHKQRHRKEDLVYYSAQALEAKFTAFGQTSMMGRSVPAERRR